MKKSYHVYILASGRNGTLYTGMTGDLARRLYEHREGLVPGFTWKYGVHRLVHLEVYDEPQQAIWREKRIKKWNRQWKINLIEKDNPEWRDLYDTLMG